MHQLSKPLPERAARLSIGFSVATRLITLLVALAAGGYLAAGCGRSGPLLEDPELVAEDCGDNICETQAGEGCDTCPLDCGFCEGCGNGACEGVESCSNCPQDCGVCDSCGDAACDQGENCVSCVQDCGQCANCGDVVCDASESCASCPLDCGFCPTCGNGACDATETCASCPGECGVCVNCGNGFCEAGEDCFTCPEDCGQCNPIGCFEIVTCSLACIDLMQDPPDFSVTCVANCVALGCADVQFFVDQVLTCAFSALPTCGGDFGCIQSECGEEFSACINANCTQ